MSKLSFLLIILGISSASYGQAVLTNSCGLYSSAANHTDGTITPLPAGQLVVVTGNTFGGQRNVTDTAALSFGMPNVSVANTLNGAAVNDTHTMTCANKNVGAASDTFSVHNTENNDQSILVLQFSGATCTRVDNTETGFGNPEAPNTPTPRTVV